ncbi:imidazoleglycerol-phosphate dehydratase HisB [Kineosporia babensis]|uniref:Imidazoleglycerol-phosphate dehydratase n=1 Tax=Kineosporia babensis TaxID=499548 RepID=A0A9X1T2Q2_9ACTN|nr:imidazoleglycerol-phosphate dehydratase HisB [Kineosporia babensis]MCD5314893.1 imidazoleglycerol-phosphate dehydratase HisB [Kineosporia babensis]
MSEPRTARISRSTKETSIELEVNLDGTGTVEVSTGIGFYDHMLHQLGKHGMFDLKIKVQGDLWIDGHHTMEDTAIALGQAFDQALGDRRGVRRYADRMVPLDESLSRAVVDLSGRPYLVYTAPENIAPMIGEFDTTLIEHIWESFAHNARMTLHVDTLRGRNAHHIVESQYKAVARALRDAVSLDEKETGIPSTKGLL